MSQFESQQNNCSAEKSTEKRNAGNLGEVYRQTEDLLRQAVTSAGSSLVDAPPGSGKTTSIFKIISETDGDYTYLTKRTDLYDQADRLSRKYGVTPTVISSPFRDCPSFDEQSPHYDPEAKSLYKHGIWGGPLHDLLNLTCTPDCPYVQFWNGFDVTDHDVLIGNYKHAHIPSIVENRIVIIDEYPGGDFEQKFNHAPQMIGKFLKQADGLPFNDWDDLMGADESQSDEICRWIVENNVEIDAKTIIDTDETTRYHSLTPFLIWTVLDAFKRDNGFSIPTFNLDPSETLSTPFGDFDNNRRVAIDHENRAIHVLTQPNLSGAISVVGLDGTPLLEQWDLATGEDFEQLTLFEPGAELNSYIHDILGITIKQTNEHLKPYHGGHISPNRDEGILYGVEVAEGQKPALIAPKKALDAYDDAGILDRAKRSMNYARVLSSNEFKGEPVGVIHGAPHPGDATLKRWAGYSGPAIEGDGDGMNKTYGEFGDSLYHHYVHDQVLQAILRFGRGECDATVYVNTAAMPDWLDIDTKVTVERFNTETKRTIADHLREAGGDGATKTDIIDDTGISQTTVEDILYDFRDYNLVEEEQQSDWPYTKNFRWSP